MSSVTAAQLQEWFDRLADLPAHERTEQLARLAETDPALTRQLEELLAADSALADTPTEPLLPELALLRRGATFSWEGRRVGAYRVLETLGSGGMGTVHRAENVEQPGEFVAIKFLRDDRDDATLRRRFQLERQVLESLRHVGIARLLGGGEYSDGTPYVVMELIEGENLLAYAERQRLDLGQRLELLLKVCAAVSHAHARQVVHRDIKASNILVNAQGQPKLLDFGIAKPLQAQFGLQHLEHTSTAQRFFSVSSAAPEQLTGAATGPACDVYALGALLYELLCGEAPLVLQGLTPGQIELTILKTVPPPPSARVAATATGLANARARQRGLIDRSALAEALRGELDHITATALRKQPGQRQPSVAALARQLRAVRDGNTALPLWWRAVDLARQHRVAALAALVIVAIVLALMLWPTRPQLTTSSAVTTDAEPAQEIQPDPAPAPSQRAEVLLALAQTQYDRGAYSVSLTQLEQAQALLSHDEASRELRMRLLLLRAAANTGAGDFPAAAQALAEADQLAPTPDERTALALRRAHLLSARGRDDEAATLLRELAAETLPRLSADDPLAVQIRQQVAALETPSTSATPAATTPADTSAGSREALVKRLENLAGNMQHTSGETAAAPAAASISSVNSTSALASLVGEGRRLNAQGSYSQALPLLETALELQRSDPSLRHSDEYRVGVLAAAIARHGSDPSTDTQERLQHELARESWLSSDNAKAAWREQAAVAARLGVRPVQ